MLASTVVSNEGSRLRLAIDRARTVRARARTTCILDIVLEYTHIFILGYTILV
eukprot:COSAG02_NODE_1826_length_10754_cov_4.509714_9_plen_53_part_00